MPYQIFFVAFSTGMFFFGVICLMEKSIHKRQYSIWEVSSTILGAMGMVVFVVHLLRGIIHNGI